MIPENINTGTPNQKDGDKLRDAFVKVVNIFTDIYSKLFTKTSELINDGQDGINPFITLQDIPDNEFFQPEGTNVKLRPEWLQIVGENDSSVGFEFGSTGGIESLVNFYRNQNNLSLVLGNHQINQYHEWKSTNPYGFVLTSTGEVKLIGNRGSANEVIVRTPLEKSTGEYTIATLDDLTEKLDKTGNSFNLIAGDNSEVPISDFAKISSTFIYSGDLFLADANNANTSGRYRVGTSWQGSPFSNTDSKNQGYLMNHVWSTADNDYAFQTFNSRDLPSISKYRRKTNNVWSVWYDMWNSENDGAGSGLDADLLDGLQASAFATAAQGALADSAVQNNDSSLELRSPDINTGSASLRLGERSSSGQNYGFYLRYNAVDNTFDIIADELGVLTTLLTIQRNGGNTALQYKGGQIYHEGNLDTNSFFLKSGGIITGQTRVISSSFNPFVIERDNVSDNVAIEFLSEGISNYLIAEVDKGIFGFTDNIRSASTATVQINSKTGRVTGTEFVGDGSKLTGINKAGLFRVYAPADHLSTINIPNNQKTNIFNFSAVADITFDALWDENQEVKLINHSGNILTITTSVVNLDGTTVNNRTVESGAPKSFTKLGGVWYETTTGV